MNCNICDKSFTGLVCFQQHEASQKHKNKVKLHQMLTGNDGSQPQKDLSTNISPIITCSVCEIDLIGLSNYQMHVNSMQHAEAIAKEVSNRSDNEDNLNVTPVLSEDALVKETFSVTSAFYAKCDVCKKHFSGPEPYQQHLESETHKKKVFQSDLSSTKLNFDTVDDDKIMPFSKKEAEGSQVGSTVKPYAECKFCNMQFSGPEPYQLHIDSLGHQKKASSGLDYSLLSSGNKNSLLRCDVCDADFSGPIPYNDHIISKKHKKKVQNVEFIQKFTSPSMQPDSSTNIPIYPTSHISTTKELPVGDPKFYCDVCDKQSTGPIPHDAHLVSEGHRKKTSAAVVESDLKRKRELLMQPHLEMANELKKEKYTKFSEEGQVNWAENNLDDKTNTFSKDFYINKDLILCDKLKNIGVIPEENLNVKIFYAEDEIVFD